ncbi:MAG: hypothetical protein LBJ59_05330 [Zoogloeaceae bacterium]|jgi:hypothetical protein|nr:hypothetical protein [Zoogloeaceae bacterium]
MSPVSGASTRVVNSFVIVARHETSFGELGNWGIGGMKLARSMRGPVHGCQSHCYRENVATQPGVANQPQQARLKSAAATPLETKIPCGFAVVSAFASPEGRLLF